MTDMTDLTDEAVKALLDRGEQLYNGAKHHIPLQARCADLARALLDARAENASLTADLATYQSSVATLQRMHTDRCRALAAAQAQIEALRGAALPFSLPDETDASIAAFADEHPEEGGHVIALRAALAALPAKEGE